MGTVNLSALEEETVTAFVLTVMFSK